MDDPEQKRQTLSRIVADGQGPYVESAHFELGRSQMAAEHYAEGAATMENSSGNIRTRRTGRRHSPIWDWPTSIWATAISR